MHKLFVSFISALLILLSGLAGYSQDIPNASFENWSGGEPVDWNTTNQSILGFQYNVVNKETSDPQSGLYSARIEVVTKNIPFVGAVTVPGVLTLSELSIDVFQQTFNISGGYPFTGMPQQLAGFLKYQPVGTDTAFFGYALTRWNNGSRDTVAYAADTVTGTISTWTPFQLPLTYEIWEAPDTMSILFLCTNVNDPVAHTGTKLWVDNLSFIYGQVGIEGITFPEKMRIYADAATGRILLATAFDKPRKLDIRLNDLRGRQLISTRRHCGQGTEYIETAHLAPGVYVLSISDGKQLLDSRKIVLGR